MVEKFSPADKLSPKELAKHLRQPSGDTGREVGIQMNKGNKHICLNSYNVLSPNDGEHILEIGMGNGFFVKDLFKMARNLKYTGVDFSRVMVEEAKQINNAFVDSRHAEFYEGSIEKLAFKDNTFDSITTTNTLYFWPKPQDNIKELLRVLKPQGKLLVAYRHKNLMDQIELTQYDFEIYEVSDVENLFQQGGYNQITTQVIDESDLEFDGKPFKMQGYYTLGFK